MQKSTKVLKKKKKQPLATDIPVFKTPVNVLIKDTGVWLLEPILFTELLNLISIVHFFHSLHINFF